MTTEDYKILLPTLPKQPGIYKFIDAKDVVLYVGKAKNLKNRIASYFGSTKHKAKKVRVLVKNASRLEYTIVETEQDALLLEATLIKKYQPRYNVQLKDGKSYPYVCIKKERFPRVFVTRKVFKDGSKYFGPYTSARRVQVVIEMINKLFQLRTCTLNLSQENIDKGKYKVCLEYHVKNCKGACVSLESEEEYNEKIDQIKNMLSGRFSAVRRHLKEEMQLAAEAMEFEKAQKIKEKLAAFEDYQGRSTVVNPSIRDVDVFTIATDDDHAYVNYLKVANGAIINTFTLEMMKNLNEDEADLLAYGVRELRERFHSFSEELVVPFALTLPTEPSLKITVPKVGDKRKLLDLSQKNATYFKLQKKKQEATRQTKQTPTERILNEMKKDLQMDALPITIECFDNSNMQGTNPVASMVVFRNTKPLKREYRHYNIKTVEGPDDFASMEEVVFRRYRRLLEEERPLPQLIVIDGGKGQLSSAVKSLEKLGIEDRITIIGIAKRLEEIYFAGDSVPLHLSKRSDTLKVIQQIRNEAHRFAITFHRNQRSREFVRTELTEIPGIGEKTANKLLSHFGSVKKVKSAKIKTLIEVAGKANAEKVIRYFREKEIPK